MHAAPTAKLNILIDNQLAALTPAPQLKDGAWLVPLELFCKQLGLKVEYPDGGEMATICGGEMELCVPLNFGEDIINIDDVKYAKIKSITEPFGYEIYKQSETHLEVIHPKQLAPNFTLPDLDDDLRRLQDFRGKKTLLYLWGSW